MSGEVPEEGSVYYSTGVKHEHFLRIQNAIDAESEDGTVRIASIEDLRVLKELSSLYEFN